MGPIEEYSLLSKRVLEEIKKAIISEELPPGQKVTEILLAKKLGVSRTPVREALRILSAEGFITLSPNSSFIVNAFTLEDTKEVLQVRGALEGLAARLAAEKITDAQKGELIRTFERIDEVPKLSSNLRNEAFTRVDTDFHQVILKIAGNSRITAIENSLKDRLFRLHTSMLSKQDAVEYCRQQHKDIMDAILNHDGDLAEKKSKFHTDFIAQYITPLYSFGENDPGQT